jgi:tryptophanyl-tRNA synthetase
MRPTGRLHLGNWMGALASWVELQEAHECFFMVADWHALTTGYQDTTGLRDNIREMVLDWLAAGLDPERSVLFRQSEVKEHAELHLILSMVTPLSWLERVPTYKEQLRELNGRDLATYGFLGYPLLQAADILAYRATRVPVGEDQLPHLELTREVVRRFNHLFGEVFPEPAGTLHRAAVLPGVDGRKMSKSYGNFIALTADPEEVRTKVQAMVTDPRRIHRADPGRPEVCDVFVFHRLFNAENAEQIAADCRGARIGCVQCKKLMAARLNEVLEPVRRRRAALEEDPELVERILEAGAVRARREAAATLRLVRQAVGL